MAKVDADPEEILKFAQMLQRFNQDLSNNTRVLQGQFRSLGETWKDQQHAKFAQEFEHLIGVLRQFMQSSEQQIPLLQKKARILKEFLESQR
jgi:uncharacterized protein YukE